METLELPLVILNTKIAVDKIRCFLYVYYPITVKIIDNIDSLNTYVL